MARRFGGTPPAGFSKQGIAKDVRLLTAGVGKGRFARGLCFQMAEEVGSGVHAHDLVPQAFAACQMAMRDMDELVPSGKHPWRALSFILPR